MLQLDDFLASLMEDRLLRNSREVIRFLNLDTNCPEILVSPPQLVFQHREKPGFCVSLIHFIPQFNMLVACLNNKKSKQACVHFYHFRNKIEDSFTLLTEKSKTLPKESLQEADQELDTMRFGADHRSRSFIVNAQSQKYNIDCMVVSPPEIKNEP